MHALCQTSAALAVLLRGFHSIELYQPEGGVVSEGVVGGYESVVILETGPGRGGGGGVPTKQPSCLCLRGLYFL